MPLTHGHGMRARFPRLSRMRNTWIGWRVVGLLALVGLCLEGLPGRAAAISKRIEFDMVVSGGASTCLPKARGHVTVTSPGTGAVQLMSVKVTGLPPNTGFVLFVIQLPNAPFGLSWYQGDVDTDANGTGRQVFIGRFNAETFIVAPGSGPAPTPHGDKDASTNPATKPVHTYHVGLWFDSPTDAAAAGCPNTTTPFNGDHTAGIQVLNTSHFPDLQGPLGNLEP